MTNESSLPKIKLDFIQKVQPIFKPMRYKILYGGRGGLKSWTVAQALIILSLQKKVRILCTREFQNSIKESVMKLLSEQIDRMGLTQYFKILNTEITNVVGSQFIFTGLHNNVTKIKSMEGINYVWCEESEAISEESWAVLIPTIRAPGSEIWITFNPLNETDPVYQRFVVNPPPNAWVQKLSWRDNPWISEELLAEKDYLYSVDKDAYDWVWEGNFLKRSKAQVLFDKCRVADVVPKSDWAGPYYGADWGFSEDPTRMVKCWVHDNTLYIQKEVHGQGVEINDIPELFYNADNMCNRYQMRCDSARPEIISYMKRNGFPKVVPCSKGPGSVEQGIAFLRSFKEIVIDPSCTHTIEESRLYKFKTDRLTGEVSTDIIDKYNHSWDAVRYALELLMPHRRPGTIRQM